MFVTVALGVHHQGDQSDKKRETLTKQDMKDDSFCLLVAHGVAVPETLGEGVGDVKGHGGHPAEEGDEGVLDDVAKGYAQRLPQIAPVYQGIQAVMDPSSKESKEDVKKETDGELSKQFRPIVLQHTVDNKGDQEEEGGDEDENRIKLLRLLSVFQLFLC